MKNKGDSKQSYFHLYYLCRKFHKAVNMGSITVICIDGISIGKKKMLSETKGYALSKPQKVVKFLKLTSI